MTTSTVRRADHTTALRRGAAAVTAAAAAAGFGLAMNLVHYPGWERVPADAFAAFQADSGARTVPTAAVLGLLSATLTVLVAIRGLPAVSRGWLWVAVALAVVPWVATPALFLPLQAALEQQGPTPDLVGRLVLLDLALRTVPPILQTGVLFVALWRAVQGRSR